LARFHELLSLDYLVQDLVTESQVGSPLTQSQAAQKKVFLSPSPILLSQV